MRHLFAIALLCQVFVYSSVGKAQEKPVGGEFRKCPEFLSFFSLIPSSACATFSLFFCMPSSSLSDLVDLAGSVLWLPNPS